ncbi:protein containing tetratricopeptide repeat [Hahella chejuensis KCTC 2396]|uniref:Protein containing tetratricopeptide repeat n=1 Tax=Hahella chejuensis (strain KCTC 2396) TaxID=349521 RepID=Q2SGE9_HAHCH|nr:hypothetical protein [Hahella chejuensis]ABC30275.1 protein containing tetratricopeptide repeat [Hahella chejuensis KCTC 2396]
MTDKNPIERELEKLDAQWETFVESERPILRWCIDPDAGQLVAAFLKMREQFDETSGEFFVALHSEFLSLESFGYDLAEELNREIAAGVAASAEDEDGDEEVFSWRAPDPNKALSGHDALYKSCHQILDAFSDYFSTLVIAIQPHAVSDIKKLQRWLQLACEIHRDYKLWGGNLKWIIIDNAQRPAFAKLAQDYSAQIFSQTPPLNLREAMNKIMEEADDGSPGAEFRQCFVDMNYAVQNNDLPALQRRSERALVIAAEQAWFDMQCSTLLLRASGYLNAKLPEKALMDYQQAQQCALKGVEAERPGCDKLLFQAHMSEASAYLSEKRYEEAAKRFRRSADIAETQEDAMMCVESWRLQSYCLERLKLKGYAWESALRGLKAAEAIEPEQRRYTTLSYLGETLLRVAPTKEDKDYVHATMSELLGEAWREAPAAKAETV